MLSFEIEGGSRLICLPSKNSASFEPIVFPAALFVSLLFLFFYLFATIPLNRFFCSMWYVKRCRTILSDALFFPPCCFRLGNAEYARLYSTRTKSSLQSEIWATRTRPGQHLANLASTAEISISIPGSSEDLPFVFKICEGAPPNRRWSLPSSLILNCDQDVHFNENVFDEHIRYS